MKRLLIGDDRHKLVATLETILKHWGYRALASSDKGRFLDLLQETEPDLLIVGETFLTDEDSTLRNKIFAFASTGVPLLVLGISDTPPAFSIPNEYLPVPLDLFGLFEMVQRHVEKHPRKNIRLPMKLPGMLCMGETCTLAEVLSLSAKGLFIKTGFRLKQDDLFHVVFPLLGMQKEIELEGRVIYCVQPDPENNFLQGVGVEFTSLDDTTLIALLAFIENCLLKGLPRQFGERLIVENQMDATSQEPVLRFISPEQ